MAKKLFIGKGGIIMRKTLEQFMEDITLRQMNQEVPLQFHKTDSGTQGFRVALNVSEMKMEDFKASLPLEFYVPYAKDETLFTYCDEARLIIGFNKGLILLSSWFNESYYQMDLADSKRELQRAVGFRE
jgi:hypothetical protein